MIRHNTVFAASVALLSSLPSAMAQAAPTSPPCATADSTSVLPTLQKLFDALQTDSTAKLDALLAPDFFAFDGNLILDKTSFPAMIRAAHGRGDAFVWTVNEPKVVVSCDMAWIAYVDRGSVTIAGKTSPVVWHESAVLTSKTGHWQFLFVHSNRVVP